MPALGGWCWRAARPPAPGQTQWPDPTPCPPPSPSFPHRVAVRRPPRGLARADGQHEAGVRRDERGQFVAEDWDKHVSQQGELTNAPEGVGVEGWRGAGRRPATCRPADPTPPCPSATAAHLQPHTHLNSPTSSHQCTPRPKDREMAASTASRAAATSTAGSETCAGPVGGGGAGAGGRAAARALCMAWARLPGATMAGEGRRCGCRADGRRAARLATV